jgi:hypothetical protein
VVRLLIIRFIMLLPLDLLSRTVLRRLITLFHHTRPPSPRVLITRVIVLVPEHTIGTVFLLLIMCFIIPVPIDLLSRRCFDV